MVVPGALATTVYGAVGDSRGAQARGDTFLAVVAVPTRGAAKVPIVDREKPRSAVKCIKTMFIVPRDSKGAWTVMKTMMSVIDGDWIRAAMMDKMEMKVIPGMTLVYIFIKKAENLKKALEQLPKQDLRMCDIIGGRRTGSP